MSQMVSATDDARAGAPRQPPSPLDPTTKFALVVDDDPLIRNAMKVFLQHRGFVVVTAFADWMLLRPRHFFHFLSSSRISTCPG